MKTRQVVLMVSYLAFLAFALFALPGSFQAAFAPERLHAVIGLHMHEENSIFLASFLLVGFMQLGQLALMMPAANMRHILPTRPMCVLGFFFGHYVSGSYLALRTYAPALKRSAIRRWDQRAVESRVFGVLLLVAATATYSMMLGAFGTLNASNSEELAHFWHLLKTDRLAAAVIFDIFVSVVFAVDPVLEDLRRRRFAFEGTAKLFTIMLAVAICAVPGAGLAAYLVVRPRLEEEASGKKE